MEWQLLQHITFIARRLRYPWRNYQWFGVCILQWHLLRHSNCLGNGSRRRPRPCDSSRQHVRLRCHQLRYAALEHLAEFFARRLWKLCKILCSNHRQWQSIRWNRFRAGCRLWPAVQNTELYSHAIGILSVGNSWRQRHRHHHGCGRRGIYWLCSSRRFEPA